MPVHDDAPALIQLQPRLSGQLTVGPHTDGQNHQIGPDHIPLGQSDLSLVPPALKMIHAVAQIEGHAVHIHILVEQPGHFGVHRGHDLLHRLHQRHLNPSGVEVFRHLQTDEAAADDGRRGRPLPIHDGPDPIHVVHVPEGVDTLPVDAGNGGPQRGGAGGQNELVVALGILSLRPSHQKGFGLFVNAQRLMSHPDVNVESGSHHLRGLQQQILPILDDVAHIIGKPAVGVADIAPPLHNDDLRALVQPADSRRRRRSACHASHDHNLHTILPPFLNSRPYRRR